MRDHWQPIETAPKDGTDVLLASFVDGAWMYHVGGHGKGFLSGLWIAGNDSPEPTHWQPLVPPSEGT